MSPSSVLARNALLAAAALAPLACSSVPPTEQRVARMVADSPWHDAAGAVADPLLADVCREWWELRLWWDPVQATALGDPRHRGRLVPPTRALRAEKRASLQRLLRRVDGVDVDRLSAADRTTWNLVRGGLRIRIEGLQLAADPDTWSVDPLAGPQVALLSLAADQPAGTPEERAQLVERWSAMPATLDQHGANLRRGLQLETVAPENAVRKVIEQLDAILASDPWDDPLVAPALFGGHFTVAGVAREALRADPGAAGFEPGESDELPRARRVEYAFAVHDLVRYEVRPALERYRVLLHDAILPAARPDELSGVNQLPGGADYYRWRIRAETSLELEPRRIHAIGLEEIARIRAEIVELGLRSLGTGDLSEIQSRLRGDPALHFETREQVEAKAEESLARARAAMDAAFGIQPAAPCEVVRIGAHEERETTIAYYRRPAADGSRPGRYFINTYAPTTRPRYDAEVLAYHEAIPGHHLQIAIAQELEGLPLIRRHDGSTAFVEGWALYTERLSEELGLYGGDLDRLGMLSFDAWRACRLVVDTGLHALGWTRQEAIDYMLANTLLAENNVVNEVDRYIAWPGQALAYKLGQREILGLRAEAEQALGEGFDLREFHDRVLENGAVTLAVLRGEIERWLASGPATGGRSRDPGDPPRAAD